MEIVLDKSYLDGRSLSQIRNLCEEHTVLFTETLLFELLTTSEESRLRCVEKLSSSNAHVLLVPRSGPLLDFERTNRTPAPPLSARRFDGSLHQITALSARGIPLQPQEVEAIAEWSAEVEEAVLQFHGLAESIAVWCPQIRDLSGERLRAECRVLKAEASASEEVVRGIYKALDLEEFPAPEVLEPSWALFRWVQTHLLFYLDHIARYGFRHPRGVPNRVEHDYHDIEYAIAASLSGGLASRDNEVIANFQLMRPDGLLLQ